MGRKNQNTRRNFLKGGVMGAAALGIGNRTAAHASAGTLRTVRTPEWRNRQEGMRYRPLGATGMMVSAFGIGGGTIDFENYSYVHEGIERGINYIDTASRYRDGLSEITVGKIIKEAGRDKLFVSTKLSPWKWTLDDYCMDIFKGLPGDKQQDLIRKSEELIEATGVKRPGYFIRVLNNHDREIDSGYLTHVIQAEQGGRARWKAPFKAKMHQTIDESLQHLGVDHVDILHAPHGARLPAELEDPLIREVWEEIRQQGKARFLGASCHSDMANLVLKAAELDYYDMVMPAYSIVTQGSMDMAVRRAAELGLGIFGMKAARPLYREIQNQPVPAWRAEKLNHAIRGDLTMAQKCYAWVHSNPHIAGCISAFDNATFLRENLALLDKSYEVHPV